MIAAIVTESVAILILSAVIIVISCLGIRERRDLINRYMAKDVHEYIRLTADDTGEKTDKPVCRTDRKRRKWLGLDE